MRTFVLTLFWLFAVGAFLRCILVCLAKYPRTQKTTIGEDMVHIISTIAFTAWAAWLLWGVMA